MRSTDSEASIPEHTTGVVTCHTILGSIVEIETILKASFLGGTLEWEEKSPRDLCL